MFFIQFHIIQQARTRITPFPKIMAQDLAVGKAAFERSLKHIQVIDSFANE